MKHELQEKLDALGWAESTSGSYDADLFALLREIVRCLIRLNKEAPMSNEREKELTPSDRAAAEDVFNKIFGPEGNTNPNFIMGIIEAALAAARGNRAELEKAAREVIEKFNKSVASKNTFFKAAETSLENPGVRQKAVDEMYQSAEELRDAMGTLTALVEEVESGE